MYGKHLVAFLYTLWKLQIAFLCYFVIKVRIKSLSNIKLSSENCNLHLASLSLQLVYTGQNQCKLFL